MTTTQKIKDLLKQQEEISVELNQLAEELIGKHATLQKKWLHYEILPEFQHRYINLEIVDVIVEYEDGPVASVLARFSGKDGWDYISLYNIED